MVVLLVCVGIGGGGCCCCLGLVLGGWVGLVCSGGFCVWLGLFSVLVV